MTTISVQGSRAAEGTGSVTFTVSLSAPAPDAVTVRYRTIDGTANEATDYLRNPSSASFGTLSFLPGETQKTIQVSIRWSERQPEFDEAVVLELFDPNGADLPAGQAVLRGTAWILDDDNLANTRALYVSNPVVREGDAGARNAVFTVSLSQPFSTDVELAYTTRDGTATARTTPPGAGRSPSSPASSRRSWKCPSAATRALKASNTSAST